MNAIQAAIINTYIQGASLQHMAGYEMFRVLRRIRWMRDHI